MKKSLLGLSIALLFSGSAFAKSPDWNLVELSYVKAEIDDTDFEPDGFALSGSALITENIFLLADYNALSEDVFGVDIDLDTISAGVGYRYGISATTDFFATLSYEYVDASALGESESDNGYGITVGARSMLTDAFELGGSIAYIDVEEDDTTFTIDGRYYFTDNFAAGLSYGVADDADFYSVSLRYAF
ncbi:outer membrane beta-barrel protein [Planctobacterium marinum]|uniref:Outer membrane protein beta-barrel domain-containing protein n=1 Tax=Planctobacterium marinum TaxID=1631968 RepID=A0AA48I4M8_9ALTE|nr:hypothetical protein MACH26_13710 [Planctobacterium marinum]